MDCSRRSRDGSICGCRKAKAKVRLFVDTSVILAAAGSSRGASRFVFEHAQANGWSLVTAAYCIDEARRNVGKLGARAVKVLNDALVPGLTLVPTELAFNRILVFPKEKDRPVLLSALGAGCSELNYCSKLSLRWPTGWVGRGAIERRGGARRRRSRWQGRLG